MCYLIKTERYVKHNFYMYIIYLQYNNNKNDSDTFLKMHLKNYIILKNKLQCKCLQHILDVFYKRH